MGGEGGEEGDLMESFLSSTHKTTQGEIHAPTISFLS